MKINKSKIKKYIKLSLLNEITDLETGQTDFVTTRYEQCEKIIVPPIFRDLFLDKIYGENPNEMRNNLSRKYSELTDPKKQNAVLFAKAMSDENISVIMGYLNDFMNIAGVPAMFCKFLQMAIDAAAEIIDLLRLVDEKEDESKIDDPIGIYRIGIRDSFNTAADTVYNALSSGGPTSIAVKPNKFKDKLFIETGTRHLTSKAFKSTVYFCLPNTVRMIYNGITGTAGTGYIFDGKTNPVKSAADVSAAYTIDLVTWDTIFQSIDNVSVFSGIDDAPLDFYLLHDQLIKSITNGMSASGKGVFAVDVYRDNFELDFMTEIEKNPRLRELVQKLQGKSNREQNLLNQKMKETFMEVIKAMLVANQNYILFELPRLHKDISKLGKDKFYKEKNIANVIKNIALQAQN